MTRLAGLTEWSNSSELGSRFRIGSGAGSCEYESQKDTSASRITQ
jgi:hypothetical protein